MDSASRVNERKEHSPGKTINCVAYKDSDSSSVFTVTQADKGYNLEHGFKYIEANGLPDKVSISILDTDYTVLPDTADSESSPNELGERVGCAPYNAWDDLIVVIEERPVIYMF